MAQESVVEVVRLYLAALPQYGVHARRAILYGSHARGEARAASDIDLIVIAPEFDRPHTVALVKKLWRATDAADERIEPVPCGEAEWETDSGRPILEMARREGIEIACPDAAARAES